MSFFSNMKSPSLSLGDISKVSNNVFDQVKGVAKGFGKLYSDLTNPYASENYEYQKDIQQQIFGREDNAVQRRVLDLKAAGLSPVLAAGSAADAGAVVNAKRDDSSPLEALQFLLSTRKVMSEISQTKAETDRLKLLNEVDQYNLDKAKGLGLTTGSTNSKNGTFLQFMDQFLSGVGRNRSGSSTGATLLYSLGDMTSHISDVTPGSNSGSVLADTVYGAKTPNDMIYAFTNYSDYEHACFFAGIEPYDRKTFNQIKKGTRDESRLDDSSSMRSSYKSVPLATKGYTPPGWNGTR